MGIWRLVQEFFKDWVIFLCGATSLAAFGVALKYLPLAEEYREELEVLHFRCVHALVVIIAASTILRVVQHVLRRPE